MTQTEDRNPPHARFNFIALVGDVSFFFIATSFLDSATALPALINRLGGGEIFLGILLALRQAGYFLPQPISAHLLQGKTRFKPYLLQVALYGRLAYLVAALFIFLYGKTNPGLALGVFAAAYVLSWFGDGAGGVPWTALVGRTVPVQQRGRLFATTQVVGGFSRLAVSQVVKILLIGSVAAFPANLALLVSACGFFLVVSWVFIAVIREPEPTPEEILRARATENKTFAAYMADLPGKFDERPDLARLAAVQVLASTAGATAPFLIAGSVEATRGGMPGDLQTIQTVGLLALAPLWGTVTDRLGPRRTLIGQLSVSLLLPAVALLGPHTPLPLIVYLGLAYFCYGGIMDSWASVTNYILEALPDGEQTTYIGLMNAASAPSLLLPIIAGFLAAKIGYASVFIFAALLLATGLYLAFTLPETRAKSPALAE